MENAQNSFMMPIKNLNDTNYGYEQLDYLRVLGATFEESHHERFDKHFVLVHLPEGFTIDDGFINNGFKYRFIFDDAGNKRGTFLFKKDNIKVANLVMNNRFRVMSYIETVGDFKFEHVCFGNENIVLFEEAVICLNERHCSELLMLSKRGNAKKQCEAKADLKYPDWRNPLAYWNQIPVYDDIPVLGRFKSED